MTLGAFAYAQTDYSNTSLTYLKIAYLPQDNSPVMLPALVASPHNPEVFDTPFRFQSNRLLHVCCGVCWLLLTVCYVYLLEYPSILQ